MKKFSIVLIIVSFIAAVGLSFFIADYMNYQEQLEARAERCGRYISFAIETVEEKGLATGGALEYVASTISVAREFCDDPSISAELSDLWVTLVYDREPGIRQDDVLAAKLKDILARYKEIHVKATIHR